MELQHWDHARYFAPRDSPSSQAGTFQLHALGRTNPSTCNGAGYLTRPLTDFAEPRSWPSTGLMPAESWFLPPETDRLTRERSVLETPPVPMQCRAESTPRSAISLADHEHGGDQCLGCRPGDAARDPRPEVRVRRDAHNPPDQNPPGHQEHHRRDAAKQGRRAYGDPERLPRARVHGLSTSSRSGVTRGTAR